MANHPAFRVLSFRWGREPERKTESWTRLPDHQFGSRIAAVKFACLRVESGAISGAAVFMECHIRAEGDATPQPLSCHGQVPDNLEI
jgi:hypothetical protein